MLNKDAPLIDGERASPFRFLGFSAGSHACIGQKLAVQEAVLMIGRLCQQYYIGENVFHIQFTFQKNKFDDEMNSFFLKKYDFFYLFQQFLRINKANHYMTYCLKPDQIICWCHFIEWKKTRNN